MAVSTLQSGYRELRKAHCSHRTGVPTRSCRAALANACTACCKQGEVAFVAQQSKLNSRRRVKTLIESKVVLSPSRAAHFCGAVQ